MPSIGPLEIGIVMIIALFVFGPAKLPELGKTVGEGLRGFKGALTGDEDHVEEPKKVEAAKTA